MDSEWRCQGTVISRKKARPEERYWYMPSFGERDDSPPGVLRKTWRVHRVHRRGSDLSKKNRKQGEWTEASFEETNTELREPKWKFCSQSHVLKKELCPAWSRRCNVCRKINHWKGSEVCAMKEKIRSVNQDSDCRDSDSDVASVKTLNAFVKGVASKKDKLICCEMRIRCNPVRLQVTVEPLLASSPEVTSVTPRLSHLTFP